MEKVHDYQVNKIFTIPGIDRLIAGKHSEAFLKCVRRYVKPEKGLTYGEAISTIYHYMDCHHRNEYYFKNTIFNRLLLDKHDLYDTAALTELPIADSKADFIMINGTGIVYEIKSDLDNFSRLESQIADYYKAFTYVYLVVGKEQYKKAKEILKETKVGIYVLCEKGNLLCRKKAGYHNKGLSYDTIAQILRKREYENILLHHFGKLPQVNQFQYYRECVSWLKRINILTLQREMLHCLKQRTLLTIEEKIPYELKYYAYFTKENRNDCEMIQKFWGRKLEV